MKSYSAIMERIKEIIESNLTPRESYIFGFADLHGLLDKKFSDYPYGISIGRKLDDSIVNAIREGPTLQYYHHYNQVNEELYNLADRIRTDILKVNVDSKIIEPTVSTESEGFEKYLKTLTVDVSHKMIATRAGLGWIGKTDLFISKQFGL